ncbi:MAG: hypothetical protein QOE60_2989 [Thermoleophilaceae bacterium]|jgi:hypothetical protein|nr:hypothetical protein [Thermoleophilaceae bacterium]
MAKTKKPEIFEKKLEDVRERLLGDDIEVGELNRMKLQMDMLERALNDDLDFHHHDTNEHHDHVTLMEEPAVQDPSA